MTLIVLLSLLGQSGYAGSPLPAIDAALVAANVQATDVVYDIGSGDGRVVCLASKRFKCRSVGIELDANLVNLSRMTVVRNGLRGKVEIRHEDALRADLSSATVVYLYHQQAFLKLLRPRLENLSPGTRVVFLDYPPDWLGLAPVRTITVDGHEHNVFLWVCDVQDESVLIATAKLYPGVRFHEGLRDPLLVQLAQDCADLLAQRGERGYWRDGHPNWNSRFVKITQNLGMTGIEVSAMSRIPSLEGAAREMYHDWSYPPQTTHWWVLVGRHARYGDGMARAKGGQWFGVIIVAD